MKQEMRVFYPLLEYEIVASERHGRFASIVMISSKTELPRVKEVMAQVVRKTDVMASFDSAVVILMGETQKSDAIYAAKRYKSMFSEDIDLQFAVVTFPDDDVKPSALIRAAYDRLNKARQGEPGIVVSED